MESDCSYTEGVGMKGKRGHWLAEPQRWDSPVNADIWKAGNSSKTTETKKSTERKKSQWQHKQYTTLLY